MDAGARLVIKPWSWVGCRLAPQEVVVESGVAGGGWILVEGWWPPHRGVVAVLAVTLMGGWGAAPSHCHCHGNQWRHCPTSS